MAKKNDFRIERDSMGDLRVPAEALWGAQTQRAVQNFPISGRPMPRGFIRALGLIKAAAAEVNTGLGLLPKTQAAAIHAAALSVATGAHDAQFPIDVFQTGSGTSSNMNANEVIATLASRTAKRIHPNDHVNLGQSSNDVIPTAIRVTIQLAPLSATSGASCIGWSGLKLLGPRVDAERATGAAPRSRVRRVEQAASIRRQLVDPRARLFDPRPLRGISSSWP